MSQWFRMYNEILDDPKVQLLPVADFKSWVNLLCLACRSGGCLPPVSDIAFALRETENAIEALIERLRSAALIDRISGGINGYTNAMHGWEKRQYKSDSSTERVKRYRTEQRNSVVTPSESETESDTEKKKKPSLRSGQKKKISTETHGSRLPADWTPDDAGLQWAIDQGVTPDGVLRQLDRFRDHFIGLPGQRGRKSDWPATWRNWIRKSLELNGSGPGPPVDRAEAVRDAVRRAAIEADRQDAEAKQPEFFLPVENPDGKPH